MSCPIDCFYVIFVLKQHSYHIPFLVFVLLPDYWGYLKQLLSPARAHRSYLRYYERSQVIEVLSRDQKNELQRLVQLQLTAEVR